MPSGNPDCTPPIWGQDPHAHYCGMQARAPHRCSCNGGLYDRLCNGVLGESRGGLHPGVRRPPLRQPRHRARIPHPLSYRMTRCVGLAPARVALITVAVVPLTLGLGLPSHPPVHSFVAAVGTSLIFATLVSLNLLPLTTLGNVFSQTSLPSLGISVAFFCLLAIALAIWLGVSYYIVVPFLRWLGWR